ncbi:unnamed protein product [Caenorhabditis angaria]|uniref:Nicotinamide-nucleotide adenylyltransferase n=1 Tax=Caenorhabditis angaria TaxID=860376 RepID=A0A9P1I8D0_9PELO|nr:unnamed protein product [Caenorhabditis angaria]
MSTRKAALLAVGSFNPPTIAHLRMLETAKSHLETLNFQVCEGIMSPVADSYNKKSTVVSAQHRFKMVSAATKSSNWIRGDDWECTRPTWTRTLAVLKHHLEGVRQKHGAETCLFLVVGGDVVDSFPRILPDGSNLWNADDILKIIMDFGLIVISRDGATPLQTCQAMPTICHVADRITILEDQVLPNLISSTRLRQAILARKSIKYATPDDVIDYIRENNLYAA